MRLVSWSRKTVLLALVALMALGTGVAVSQSNNGPRTDRVQANFTLERVIAGSQRQCAGNDGPYTEVNQTLRGASAGDPRLTGELTVRVNALLNQVDADDGGRAQGTAEGTFRIQQDSGASTAGTFTATLAGDPGSPTIRVEGITDARVTGPNNRVGGNLIGSFTATADRSGQMASGEFGGNDDDQEQPAYIQTESCTGPQG